jgi:hypothetical protein
MGTVVVGILPDHDAVAKLADSLKAAGFDLAQLTVVSSEDPSDDLVHSGVQFVLAGDPDEDMLTTGTGIITSGGGTSVPGVTNSDVRAEMFHGASTTDLLGELEIPDGRTDDYAAAVESGRAVAGIVAGANVDKVKGLFSAAGANPVEVF